jgi:hypothetical protein
MKDDRTLRIPSGADFKRYRFWDYVGNGFGGTVFG